MSARDLIHKWEDALTQVLLPVAEAELSDTDLETVEGVAVKSALRAGMQYTYGGYRPGCW